MSVNDLTKRLAAEDVVNETVLSTQGVRVRVHDPVRYVLVRDGSPGNAVEWYVAYSVPVDERGEIDYNKPSIEIATSGVRRCGPHHRDEERAQMKTRLKHHIRAMGIDPTMPL